MNFNEALDAIKDGKVLTRKKWQGKAKVYLVTNKLNNISHIEVRTVNCIMYAASSDDLLAIDWEVYNLDEKPKEQLPQDEIVL